jgi:hypothetical protein
MREGAFGAVLAGDLVGEIRQLRRHSASDFTTLSMEPPEDAGVVATYVTAICRSGHI